ncbi:MAG TPA: hypothetical protein VG842_10590 [Sediminibacterium sp.]|nr:hypothetical protein [Sediminibacterium sp.]
MMKRIANFLVALFLFTCTLWAQQQDTPRTTPPNIMGLKMSFVTKQLALTNDEAQKFWPVYYNYSAELRQARRGGKSDVLSMEENMLNVRKKYKVEFKKILITDERVNKALTVDRDFMNVVRKELQERSRGHNKQ